MGSLAGVRGLLAGLVASGLLLAAPAALLAQSLRDSTSHPDSLRSRDSTAAAHRPSHPVLSHPVRVCAGGDVTLGTNLDTLWGRTASRSLRSAFGLSDAPDSLLAPLRPLLSGADVVLLNVEGAIGDGPVKESKCGRHSKNCYAFRQPAGTADALRRVADSAAVVGNVANNHSHDAGAAGLRATISSLTRAGVLVTGADTLATPVVTRAGDSIAVLGFHTSSDAPDARDLAAVRRHVARAVERYGAVIVTMHLGAEGADAQRTRDSTELFLGSIDRGNPVAFADSALAGGATMVIGHGPHVLRAAEWRDDRLVLYSLGNLLTYGPFRLAEPMNRGAIACATIDSARSVSAVALTSTMQLAPGVLRVDTTERAAQLVDSLSALDFPRTGVRRAAADSSMQGVLAAGTVLLAGPPHTVVLSAPAPRDSVRVAPDSPGSALPADSLRKRPSSGAPRHP